MKNDENKQFHLRESLLEAGRHKYHGDDRRPKAPPYCTDCCTMTCMLCALCCCGPCFKSAPWTLRLLPFCTAIILIMAAVITGVQFGYYRGQMFRLSPTDEIPILNKLSLAFCGELIVESTSRFSAYKFDEEPEISANKTVYSSWKNTVFADVNHPSVKNLYMLKGSTAKVSFCPDKPVLACAIKGQANFQRWAADKSWSQHCFEKRHINGRKCESITMHVKESEKVYFIIDVKSTPSWVDQTFHVDRKRYDVTSASNSCHESAHCQFTPSFSSFATIVVASDENGGRDTLVTTHCKPGLLLPIFLIVIPALACVVFGIIYLGMKWRDAKNRRQFILNPPLSSRLHDYEFKSRPCSSNLVHYNTFQNELNRDKLSSKSNMSL